MSAFLKPVIMLGVFMSTCLVGIMALTSEHRAAVLNRHNALRSELARGISSNVNGAAMPTGANIYELVYDTAIEAMAQTYANGCSYQHSNSDAGENLYMSSDLSGKYTPATALVTASNMWWAELKQYGIQKSLVLSSAEFSKGIGHWSQMAWAGTTRIGCGIGVCTGKQWQTFIVCNYKNAGNYLNQAVYKAGATCSGCTTFANSVCNATTKLCKAP